MKTVRRSNPEPRLRIGVLGLGQLSREVHLPLLASLPHVEVAAIADPSPQALAQSKPIAPSASSFSSLEEMLERTGLNGVLIATPTGQHAAHARSAILAGIPCYLEKPVAGSLSEAGQLESLATTHNAAITVGFNYRFHPRIRTLLEHPRAPFIQVRSVFTIAPRTIPVWKQSRAMGGGVLLDLASHHFDLMRYIMGAEPEQIEARIWSDRSEQDNAEVRIRFSNGAQAECRYSLCAGERDFLEFTTHHETVIHDRYAPLGYPFRPLRDFIRYQFERRRSPWKEVSFRRALLAWTDSLRRHSQPPVPLCDGIASLRMVAAAEEAARCGSQIKMEAPR